MLNKTDAIQAYILAKDGNRPHALNFAFTADAIVNMDVQTDSIAFPNSLPGLKTISEILVSQFNQQYENIYTFCIGNRPEILENQFKCNWLVVMSEKKTESVRVGCGQYDWVFSATSGKVQKLDIKINVMETSSAVDLLEVMTWVAALPYPWCDLTTLVTKPPQNSAVLKVVQQLQEIGI